MHHEQEYEAALGKLHQWLIAPAQKAFKSRFALDGEGERQEMQRQENGQRKAREPVHQRCHPKHALAMIQSPGRHDNTTAATARSPRSSSEVPKTVANMPALRSLSGDHSVKTLRTPIAA